jgi:hypothetical protein
MIFFISRAQDIDNVILMQSMGNVGFDKLRKITVCMCENGFQQNHLMKNRDQKNQTNTTGNWIQKCSDIFCGIYILIKGSKKINPIRQEGFQKNQTNTAGNRFQTCSDIFCGKYISMKIGSKKINPIRREEKNLLCVKHGFQQNSLICHKYRAKQSWQTKTIIGLKAPGHGLHG